MTLPVGRRHIGIDPIVIGALGAAGLLLTVTSTVSFMITDGAVANSVADMARLEFGEPLPWFVQDQSSLDPPSFPRRLSPLNPQEHPSGVLWPRLLADLGLFGAPVVAAITAATRRVLQRR